MTDWHRLAQLPLTYPDIGATAGDLPRGYHHLRREAKIGSGRAVFDAAGTKVLGWAMQRHAGVLVDASATSAEPGALVVVGRKPLTAACRVIYTVAEPNRCGFAYGTLRGHPESGEEFFGVRFDEASGTVYAHVVAFSRPALWWSKAGSPVASLVQRRITNRYLDALRSGPE